MSAVLDIDGLMDSPLADLHALASELGVEGYRLKGKADLAVAILVVRGEDESAVRPAVEAKYSELQAAAAERAAVAEAADEAAAEERRAADRERREERGERGERGNGGRSRGGRGGRGGRERQQGDRERGQSERGQSERGQGGGGEGGRGQGERGQGERGQGGRGQGGRGDGRQRGEREGGRGGDQRRGERGDQAKRGERRERGGRGGGRGAEAGAAEGGAERNEPAFAVSGVFESRQGGGGMLRATLGARSKDDVEVGRAEVRKYRLFRGDTVTGEAKKVKRAKGAGMVSSVSAVNGVPADQIKGDRVRFDDAETTAPRDQLAKKLFKAAPFGRGSRVLAVGPARGAASEMLTNLAAQLGKDGIFTTLAVVTAPPEGVEQAQGAGFDVVVGSLTGKSDEFTTGLKLAVERGKRRAEAGGDAVVIIDGIDLLPATEAREFFMAARNLTAHGSLTIVGSAAPGSELEAVALTTAVITGGRRIKLDKKQSWSKFGR